MSLVEFQEFLDSRASLLETLESNNKKTSKLNRIDHSKTKSLLIKNQTCAFCKETHHVSQCPKFLEFTPQRRLECLRSTKLCLNCLKPGHFIKECKSSTCKRCSGKHNTLIHFEKSLSTQDKAVEEHKNDTTAVLYSHEQFNNSHVLLSTALLFVKDRNAKTHKVRAILDPGSQSSLITSSLCDRLQLEKTNVQINLEAINNSSCRIRHKCNLSVTAHHNNYSFNLACLIISDITGPLPNVIIDKERLQIPSNIRLADPSFHLPSRVDILIGADSFWNLLCVGQIKVGREQLIMQKTKLGWIAAGPLGISSTNTVKCNLSKHIDINDQLLKFWELEEYCNQKPLSNEERQCEEHFLKTYRRDSNGRFVVHIPLKENPNVLGDSYLIARKRLVNLETRLQRVPAVRDQYVAFLQDYNELGHMGHMTKKDSHNENIAHYLPHHCVIRTESLTTKVRVIFDASAVTDNNISLNDIQLVGPALQDDLFAILLRFRLHTYVVSADIEKMFRQVLVTPEQRSLQRILWRSNAEASIDIFELNTLNTRM
ncbi:hypothetical protein ALC57_04022 [Trachymyrmex cornetzi]|uniref:CCHC-type domain-containing protein n=1 Tax=Trachymyrmex cornetzi TaxID=471704 RepID=A0A151JF45_9HYME|nr:hypothetical protein ALC57_04022 [Trachymyrmex cornetzi]